jgi:hypothetical protein
MNYLKHYNLLIERARIRTTEFTYVEEHHIIPRCMGGSDAADNLVKLTPEEHYVAHQLLVKIYPGNRSIAFAAGMMALNANKNRPNNKLYGWLRVRMSQAMQGRTFSDDTIKRMSLAKKGKQSHKKGIPTGIATPGCFKKGNIPWNLNRPAYTRALEIDGITYNSRKEAAEKLGKDMTTIIRWLQKGRAVDRGIV